MKLSVTTTNLTRSNRLSRFGSIAEDPDAYDTWYEWHAAGIDGRVTKMSADRFDWWVAWALSEGVEDGGTCGTRAEAEACIRPAMLALARQKLVDLGLALSEPNEDETGTDTYLG